MKIEALLSAMEEIAARLGINLSYEDLRKGEVSTHGALFTLRGSKRIIIHKGLAGAERADLLAEILAGEDLDSIHIAPEVRARLEQRPGNNAEPARGAEAHTVHA